MCSTPSAYSHAQRARQIVPTNFRFPSTTQFHGVKELEDPLDLIYPGRVIDMALTTIKVHNWDKTMRRSPLAIRPSMG